MLESLITSKTRIRILVKFFSNAENKAYLRELAEEFGESTNAVRIELNRLYHADLLKLFSNGNTKLYQANTGHTLFPELHKLVKKYMGIDLLVDRILTMAEGIDLAFITGDYANGIDSGIIDIVIVGNIERYTVQHLLYKTEEVIKRKIRPLFLTTEEFSRLRRTLNVERALIVLNNSAGLLRRQVI